MDIILERSFIKNYEEFKKRLLDSEVKEDELLEEENKNKTILDYFVEIIGFLDKYKYIIFGAMIILPIIGIAVIVISKHKDDFDLK